MEDPNDTVQLSQSAAMTNGSAQIIKPPLPSASGESSGPDLNLDPDPGQNQQKPTNPSINSATSGAAGGHIRTHTPLWYALYFPQLDELSEARQQKVLNLLAGIAESISSTVSFHPLALICEIRSSLKYFGDINAIHNKLEPLLTTQLQELQLPEYFLYSASPSITGSLLLARSGHNALVYQKENLRSALSLLPIEVLQLHKEQNRRLYNMGVRYLRDIWRLPSDGLRKRFGSNFINQLNKALGKAPEPTRNYLPPPAFITSYDLPYELENLDHLLPVADELLAQLCDFLRRRDLSTSHLQFSLLHEKRNSTVIDMGLRQASRSREHIMLLLETHFTNLSIPAPVIAFKIEIKKFDAFMNHRNSLLPEGKSTVHYNNNNFNEFMEKLRARLGNDHIKSVSTAAEHCPEYASQQLNYEKSIQSNQSNASVVKSIRPFWLLPEPLLLNIRRGKLYHRKALTIINGPERIETYWWSGTDVCRDYYVAKEKNGSRLWIYHEKQGERNWYLHGFFS